MKYIGAQYFLNTDLVIGAILCMFFIDNRLLGKLFSFVFPLDRFGLRMVCYLRRLCKKQGGENVFPRGERQKKDNNLIVNV